MERISAPGRDYYIAAYAVPTDEGYEGYAKVCTAEPDSVWDCQAVVKVAGGTSGSVDGALHSAERHAQRTIDLLRVFGRNALRRARPTTIVVGVGA